MKIVEEKLTEDNLKIIYNLDKNFYREEILTMEWYLKRYNENHKALFLIDDDSNIVGYLLSVPIKKELYRAIINSVLTNDLYINSEMYVDKSKYHYIVSILIKSDYQNKGYGQKLMNYLFKNNKGKYCAISISQAGFKIANKNMKFISTIDQNTSIFIKNV